MTCACGVPTCTGLGNPEGPVIAFRTYEQAAAEADAARDVDLRVLVAPYRPVTIPAQRSAS